MTARADILAAVRQAVAGAAAGGARVSREYRRREDLDDPVALFAGRVADYRATVVRCGPAGVEAAIRDVLDGRCAVVPEGLPWHVHGSVPEAGLSVDELDSLGAVVTAAALGIAETGTIVLDHGPGQGRRALSLVPDLHVCVVRADQVVGGVPEAVAALDPSRPQTWISGPSATSDIELSRVEGVHGPRTLVVVLVG